MDVLNESLPAKGGRGGFTKAVKPTRNRRADTIDIDFEERRWEGCNWAYALSPFFSSRACKSQSGCPEVDGLR